MMRVDKDGEIQFRICTISIIRFHIYYGVESYSDRKTLCISWVVSENNSIICNELVYMKIYSKIQENNILPQPFPPRYTFCFYLTT